MRATLDTLIAKYNGKIYYVYRHLPLTQIHDQAWIAAEASECAAEQGRFWPFHDLIFDNASALSEKMLASLAKRAGLRNVKRFEQCLRSGKYRKLVERDVAVAQNLGINGTPAFFIGRETGEGMMEGEVISGAQPLGTFVPLVEKTLKAAGK
ncbi:MAG: thioredoxin domain-containing protein [SAR324 cluster bacterium]|nr:thioredoxin domain-containing protein [SAR324 cluster bacterium]MCZ6629142.1 thioredoxin domain-containing protein [SAR324 cluster bacterium]MCZ6647463.1 thioredoxin domain-containing protein [SAR324 cluster bacterium]